MYVRPGQAAQPKTMVQNDPLAYFGEAAAECLRYEAGEVEKSHCQTGPCEKGLLAVDVLQIPRGLLIADFGVGWSGVKKITKDEKLLHAFFKHARADLHWKVLRIFGFTDCVGKERNNDELRRRRAAAVFALLDPALRSRVDFFGAARPGEYVADNKTKEGRANNRGVIIELWTLPHEIVEIKDKKLPLPCPGCKPPIPIPPIPCSDCKPIPPGTCVGPKCKPGTPTPKPPPPLKLPQPWTWPWSAPNVTIVQDFPPDDRGGSSWVWGPLKHAAIFLGISITVGMRRLSNVELQDALDAAWLVFQLEQGGLRAVIGLAGEAAAEKIIARVIGVSDGTRILNLNRLVKDFPVLDLVAPTGLFSVKVKGLLARNAPVNLALAQEYTRDLVDMALGDHPLAKRKLAKAAKILFDNSKSLKTSGSWPQDLIARSAADVERYIRNKSKLLVPHDHVQILKRHIGAILNDRVRKGLRLPPGTDPVTWVNSFVDRIDSIGVKASDLQVMLEATKHLPKEQVGRLLKELAALERRRRGL